MRITIVVTCFKHLKNERHKTWVNFPSTHTKSVKVAKFFLRGKYALLG